MIEQFTKVLVKSIPKLQLASDQVGFQRYDISSPIQKTQFSKILTVCVLFHVLLSQQKTFLLLKTQFLKVLDHSTSG